MFYKYFIFVFIVISGKCFCDSSQLNPNLNLNNSESNDYKSDQLNSDLSQNNGINETTINKTEHLVINDLPSVPTPSPPNEMLSFEEWRKKIAEKSVNLEAPSPKITSHLAAQSQQSVPTLVQSSATVKQKPITKRARNFASYECGAKVVDSNPESESVQRILNEQTDEYMLNPCKANIWFVIELCETIQPKTIEIANFELYSSVPKEFAIEASDRYPTREWSRLGTFNATDERSVQRFQMQDNGFVKFVRIEMLSHYGSEHFCPLSVVRVFGTSLFEEVERIDNMDIHQQRADEDESTVAEELVGEENSGQNLFGTARDAVFNIVRKAAEALNGNNKDIPKDSSNSTDSSSLETLIQLESIAFRLFPKVDKYLHNCTKTSLNHTNCYYLKTVFGQPLYDLLIDHSFNCYVSNNSTKNGTQYECTSQPKNNTNESIKIESSIEPKDLDIISPTKPILNDLSSKSVEINVSEESVSKFSEDSITSSITQTISEVTSSSTESLSVLTTVDQSSDSSDKNEELPSIPVINNEVLNESENIVKTEDLNKNITTNETIVKNNQISSQPQNGGSNGGSNGYVSTGSGMVQSKESVVIRLSNRIKTLEVNLSLSSQYLEELSLRYRKQMEEMQRAFNITISKLNETNIRAAERDLKQQESIALLETKLNALNTQMSVLLAERESLNWHYIEVHIALMMIEVIVVIVFLFICVNRLSQRINFLQINESFKDLSLKAVQNSVSPNKRSHPNANPCHLPTKRLIIEGDSKPLDSISNKMVNNQRKIRKKKKKGNGVNGGLLSNSLESEGFVLNQNKDSLTVYSNASLISKSQSTPVLDIKSQLNGKHMSLSNCSCHSSTSGVSSNSGVSHMLTNSEQNVEINANKKSSNDKYNRKPISDNKSNSLKHSLKKLLNFDRK